MNGWANRLAGRTHLSEGVANRRRMGKPMPGRSRKEPAGCGQWCAPKAYISTGSAGTRQAEVHSCAAPGQIHRAITLSAGRCRCTRIYLNAFGRASDDRNGPVALDVECALWRGCGRTLGIENQQWNRRGSYLEPTDGKCAYVLGPAPIQQA